MKQHTIDIHSFSKTITNSSTEIYVMATDDGINFIKAIINQVLSDSGSELEFDDMYDIKIVKTYKHFDKVLYPSTYQNWRYKITPKGEYSNVDVLNKINDIFDLDYSDG